MPIMNHVSFWNAAALSGSEAAGGSSAETVAAANTAGDGNRPRQAPFYRTTLGNADITIVSDGDFTLTRDFLYPDPPPEEFNALLASAYRPGDELLLPANAMVIDINGQRVLIDAGSGDKFQPGVGKLAENLRAAGIAPESIDAVVFTHLHPDHLWGATDAANEALIFPNARFIARQGEYAFWSSPDLPDQLPTEEMRNVTLLIQAHLDRLGDRLELVERDVLPGISYIPTPGHTADHASVMIESGGETLLSVGDVIADAVVAFERPDWPVGIDKDPEQGVRTRIALLDRLKSDRQRSFGYHLPWPGLGHVGGYGKTYRWHPERWTM